jgi:translation initiation factor 1
MNSKTVFATGVGRVCRGCGWPERDCKRSRNRAPSEALPQKIAAKLRLEKSGRSGKTVTVVYDLPRNEAFLEELAQELKRACGAGGTAGDGTVELQGDQRQRIRAALERKGFLVKG